MKVCIRVSKKKEPHLRVFVIYYWLYECRRDQKVWQEGIFAHNGAILSESSPSHKLAKPWELEPWLVMMRGTMAEPAWQLLRAGFSPHSLLLNVSDIHGEHIVI